MNRPELGPHACGDRSPTIQAWRSPCRQPGGCPLCSWPAPPASEEPLLEILEQAALSPASPGLAAPVTESDPRALFLPRQLGFCPSLSEACPAPLRSKSLLRQGFPKASSTLASPDPPLWAPGAASSPPLLPLSCVTLSLAGAPGGQTSNHPQPFPRQAMAGKTNSYPHPQAGAAAGCF